VRPLKPSAVIDTPRIDGVTLDAVADPYTLVDEANEHNIMRVRYFDPKNRWLHHNFRIKTRRLRYNRIQFPIELRRPR
jgi:hypothetical protein